MGEERMVKSSPTKNEKISDCKYCQTQVGLAMNLAREQVKKKYNKVCFNAGFNQGKKQATADFIKDEIKFLKRLDNNDKVTWNLGNWNKVERRLSKLKQMLVEK
jgi:hypothetical protein